MSAESKSRRARSRPNGTKATTKSSFSEALPLSGPFRSTAIAAPKLPSPNRSSDILIARRRDLYFNENQQTVNKAQSCDPIAALFLRARKRPQMASQLGSP